MIKTLKSNKYFYKLSNDIGLIKRISSAGWDLFGLGFSEAPNF